MKNYLSNNKAVLSNDQVYKLITRWTEANHPFCISRFGDGEGLFAFLEWDLKKYYNSACMKHWGEVPSEKEKQIISQNILYTYSSCDIAGLPFGIKGKIWERTHRDFLKYFTPELTCSMEIHIELERSGFLEQLIEGKKIFYVSCRNVDKYLKEKGAREIDRILISPQYKFESVKPETKFYNQVISVQQQIQKLDLTGWVCLLGAGVAGNHLGIIMRSAGGMVIDTGSVFDLWAGKNSRGWIKKYKRPGNLDEKALSDELEKHIIFDNMKTTEKLATWLATKQRDYKTGVQIFIDLNIDVKKIPFLQAGSGKIQRIILNRQLEHYARVKKIRPRIYKEKPPVTGGREKLKSQQMPKTVRQQNGERVYERPLIDTNPSVKFDQLPANLQQLFKENSRLKHEMNALHAELKLIQDDPDKEDRRKCLAQNIVENQKKTRANWEVIDKWWNSRNQEKPPAKKPEDAAAEEAIKKDRRIKANLNYIRRYKNTSKEKQLKQIAVRKKELDEWGVSYEELIK